MQGNSHTPSWYIVDVTELFTVHCSQRAIDITVTHLGDLSTLTDLCCTIAVMQLRGFNSDIDQLINDYVSPDIQNNQVLPMISKVVKAYTELLRIRFICMVLYSKSIDLLNTLEIYDVKDISQTNPPDQISPCVAVQILARFKWSDDRIAYGA